MVLGLRMQPYAICHEIALQKRQNPLLSLKPDEFRELPLAERGRAMLEAVQLCCWKWPFFERFWQWAYRRVNLHEEAQKFFFYRAYGSQDFPTAKMPRTPGLPYHHFGSPESARLINYLCAYHGILIQTHFKGSPLNFPFGLARMLYSAYLESEGKIWIENHIDADGKRRRDLWEKLHPEGGFAIGDEACRKMAEQWNRDHPESPVPVEPAGKKEKL